MVNRLVPRGELSHATLELAGEILAASPVAVRQAKRALDKGVDATLEAGLELEDHAWRAAVATEDRDAAPAGELAAAP